MYCFPKKCNSAFIEEKTGIAERLGNVEMANIFIDISIPGVFC